MSFELRPNKRRHNFFHIIQHDQTQLCRQLIDLSKSSRIEFILIYILISICIFVKINKLYFMVRGRQTNPLKKRRMEKGLTQKQLSEYLGITQSQYSNIENGETDPTKYLKPISEVLGCQPNEVFSGQILTDMEKDFINDPIKETQCIYHYKNPKKVYVKMEGWFTVDEVSLSNLCIDGIGSDNGN